MNPNMDHGKSEARRGVCPNCNPNSRAKEFVCLLQEGREQEKKKMCNEHPFRDIRSVRVANSVQTGKSLSWGPAEGRERGERCESCCQLLRPA